MPWLEHLRTIASQHNQCFASPLSISEVRGVAKSIAKWTWSEFGTGEVDFSAKQAKRGRLGAEKRWEGHEALDYLQPWEEQGVSRATYFRHLAKAKEASAHNDGTAVDGTEQ